MDLRLVEYFVAVIDHGSVTKAAQARYIAQPSLSQAIRGLERQPGCSCSTAPAANWCSAPTARRSSNRLAASSRTSTGRAARSTRCARWAAGSWTSPFWRRWPKMSTSDICVGSGNQRSATAPPRRGRPPRLKSSAARHVVIRLRGRQTISERPPAPHSRDQPPIGRRTAEPFAATFWSLGVRGSDRFWWFTMPSISGKVGPRHGQTGVEVTGSWVRTASSAVASGSPQ